MSITAAELELIVQSLLMEGVPPGVVARVFDLEAELTKRAQRDMRIRRYGTDDLVEYTEQLQWDAVDEARQIILRGSQVEKTRFISAILGKQIAVAARRTPDSQRDAQHALLTMLEGMRTDEAEQEPTEDKSKFVVVAGTPED